MSIFHIESPTFALPRRTRTREITTPDNVTETELARVRLEQAILKATKKASEDTSSFPNSRYRVYEAAGIRILEPQNPGDVKKIVYPSSNRSGDEEIQGITVWLLPENDEPTVKFTSMRGEDVINSKAQTADLINLSEYVKAAGDFKLINMIPNPPAQVEQAA